MVDDVTVSPHSPSADRHRRHAAHLYGLIVSGAVLATASDQLRLSRVSVILVVTLTVYWAAETYVHWIAARAHLQRDLRADERRAIVGDGWPLVAASAMPLLILVVEALLGVDTAVALDVALVAIAGLLFFTGWQMGRDGGLTGARQAISVGVSGLLGVSLVALKALLH